MKSRKSKLIIRLVEEKFQKEQKTPLKNSTQDYYDNVENCIPGTP